MECVRSIVTLVRSWAAKPRLFPAIANPLSILSLGRSLRPALLGGGF